MDPTQLTELDRRHVWHPYSAVGAMPEPYAVVSAADVRLRLLDGRQLIDGMSSWWCAIHGYSHPRINQAIREQLERMAHVMFGGLTHEPGVNLAKQLVDLTPDGLDSVFFCDSGSVSVEVAMKMAIQYWHSRGQQHKNRFASFRRGYHGDTFGAMSICDPYTGIHALFRDAFLPQHFVASPACRFGEPCEDADVAELEALLRRERGNIAAVVVEPIVQGAGGMWFYSADYLRRARALCEQYEVLLILDEIATGFGRTGKMFACEHAGVTPDIMCVGKALTGGYISLAATLASAEISRSIADSEPGALMHGPTFMGNPLACSAALASLELLRTGPWQARVARIEQRLAAGLEPCREMSGVRDVRVLGAIGVVELERPVDMSFIQPLFVKAGVWIRPFGKLIYLMPPFIIDDGNLNTLIAAVVDVTQQHLQHSHAR